MAFQRCKARSKTTGNQCKNAVQPGYEVCRFHGGKTPRGRDLPQTTHARYSKHLPERLAARYEAAAHDPDLLAMREEIRLIDSMLQERLETLQDGGASDLWPKARKEARRFRHALATKNTEMQAEAFLALERIITDGATEAAARAEVLRLIQDRRRLAESEQKRVVTMQQMVTTEQIMTFIGALSSSIRTHITDKAVISAIDSDLARLLQRA